MQIYRCQPCGNTVYFENSLCLSCGHTLGFIAGLQDVCALEATAPGEWRALAGPPAARYRFCQHAGDEVACNWMVSADDPSPLCRSCRLTRTVPDLAQARLRQLWALVEQAKRRLCFGLAHLRLPILTRADDAAQGLCFDILADTPTAHAVTGHESGVITINVAEADAAHREREREGLGESYRTLLGHVRHEVGHFYWDRLIRDSPQLVEFRSLFGDEQAGYLEAQTAYYNSGPPEDWQRRYISRYASMHPWEDWAECFAHYLHMVDVLETAAQFDFCLRTEVAVGSGAAVRPTALPDTSFDGALQAWIPLSFAINSLNRSMGMPDCYPFSIPPEAVAKLHFVHRVLGAAAAGAAATPVVTAGSALATEAPPPQCREL